MAIGDAVELSREWRDHVQKDIDSLLSISRDNATAIAELRKVAEAHQDRLAKLEAAPEGLRGWLGVVLQIGGCLSMLVGASLGVVSVAVALFALTHR